MRNLWIQTDAPFATWVADLTALRATPERLLDAVLAIVAAGARHRVARVIEAPALGVRDGADPAPALRAAWAERREVDLFGFTGAAMMPGAPGSSTTEAVLAWFDRADQLVEGPVTDPGALLRRLEPEPGSIAEGFTASYPPVRLTGRVCPYAGVPPELTGPGARRPLEVRIAIHSDLWLPFVFGSAHPWADHRRMFDNRALAERHTPRLNEFLREVAAIAYDAGGGWRVDEDDSGAAALRWLDVRGVRLDAAPPELMPPEALAAEWF